MSFAQSDFNHSKRFTQHTKMKESDLFQIYDLYLKAVSNGVPHTFGEPTSDPFLSTDLNELKVRTANLRKRIVNMQGRKMESITVTNHIRNTFVHSCEKKQREILSVLEFDFKNAQVSWLKCGWCKSTFLRKTRTNKTQTLCDHCHKDKKAKRSEKDLLTNNYLPIWMKDEKIQYDVPPDLKGLTLGEKLLIQKYSTLLPLVHVYKGRVGNYGNSVSFNKDTNSICRELPRKKAEIVVVIKQYYNSKENTYQSQNFRIRKTKVLNALKWLRQYHKGYSDITINESNLDWMGDASVSYLNPSTVKSMQLMTLPDTGTVKSDNESVSMRQTDVDIKDDIIYHNGVTTHKLPTDKPEHDEELLHEIKDTAKEQKSLQHLQTMDFPHISDEPIDEFKTMLLMANCYPWLFPGGFGDRSNVVTSKGKNNDIQRWAELLMRWYDGRFMRDDMFSFHLLNYLQRHSNNSNGLMFVKRFIEDDSISVEDIKEQIHSGDQTFIKKLQYFAGSTTRGSDAFWRKMKDEVDDWITYHIEQGNGPPTLFLTFSCAEYWWPDLEKLIYERCIGTEDENLARDMYHSSDTKTKMKAKSILVERYSAVVQEYFQVRMDHWMETVGKKEFGITHYWMRFEFAKGRGTIHAHILAITKDAYLIGKFHEAHKRSKREATELMAKYARDTLSLTAEKPLLPYHTSGERPNPLSIPYCSITSHDIDRCDLVENVHMHECNAFCLRYKKWNG